MCWITTPINYLLSNSREFIHLEPEHNDQNQFRNIISKLIPPGIELRTYLSSAHVNQSKSLRHRRLIYENDVFVKYCQKCHITRNVTLSIKRNWVLFVELFLMNRVFKIGPLIYLRFYSNATCLKSYLFEKNKNGE